MTGEIFQVGIEFVDQMGLDQFEKPRSHLLQEVEFDLQEKVIGKSILAKQVWEVAAARASVLPKHSAGTIPESHSRMAFRKNPPSIDVADQNRSSKWGKAAFAAKVVGKVVMVIATVATAGFVMSGCAGVNLDRGSETKMPTQTEIRQAATGSVEAMMPKENRVPIMPLTHKQVLNNLGESSQEKEIFEKQVSTLLDLRPEFSGVSPDDPQLGLQTVLVNPEQGSPYWYELADTKDSTILLGAVNDQGIVSINQKVECKFIDSLLTLYYVDRSGGEHVFMHEDADGVIVFGIDEQPVLSKGATLQEVFSSGKVAEMIALCESNGGFAVQDGKLMQNGAEVAVDLGGRVPNRIEELPDGRKVLVVEPENGFGEAKLRWLQLNAKTGEWVKYVPQIGGGGGQEKVHQIAEEAKFTWEGHEIAIPDIKSLAPPLTLKDGTPLPMGELGFIFDNKEENRGAFFYQGYVLDMILRENRSIGYHDMVVIIGVPLSTGDWQVIESVQQDLPMRALLYSLDTLSASDLNGDKDWSEVDLYPIGGVTYSNLFNYLNRVGKQLIGQPIIQALAINPTQEEKYVSYSELCKLLDILKNNKTPQNISKMENPLDPLILTTEMAEQIKSN